jgi:nucleobase:cation symporter-1, NCS1 family
MFVEYYFVKRGNLKLPDLFQGNTSSRYWYTRGVNYRAVVTVIISLLPCLPSFAAQIDPGNLGMSTTGINFFYISFIFTYAFACLFYYCSYIVFPEKGDAVVEKSFKFEQFADDNDEEERAAMTLGLAEEGSGHSSIRDGEEKRVPMVNCTKA